MLQVILPSVGLESHRCAELLGIDQGVFDAWICGQESIPPSYVPLLADSFGLPADILCMTKKEAQAQGIDLTDITAAIWYRFRGADLEESDREYVLLIRQLGYFQNQLEEATASAQLVWKALFETVFHETDLQAPPSEQGRQAARLFRDNTGLSHGATGIADLFRSYLRTAGLLIIESPLPKSRVEGCSFYVGSHLKSRPCLFANNHGTTWFRRNVVLMHELCHAIFDAPAAGASLDLARQVTADDSGLAQNTSGPDVAEERAEAFAVEALLPARVLQHLCNQLGIKPQRMLAAELAQLVAASGVEQRMVVKACKLAGLIPSEQAGQYQRLEITDELKERTERALTTEEFLQRYPEKKGALLVGKRSATRAGRSIRLPVNYIVRVVNAVSDLSISPGKAAELLMVDRETFIRRFSDVLTPGGAF